MSKDTSDDEKIPKLIIPEKGEKPVWPDIPELPLHYRNPKFKHEYCDMLIEHMSNGLSVSAFAGVVGVTRPTVFYWIKNIDNFKHAYEIGFVKSLLFWETLGMEGTKGKIPNFNAGTWIFSMKHKFGWTDKTELRVSGDFITDSNNSDTLKAIPRKELYKLIQASENG